MKFWLPSLLALFTLIPATSGQTLRKVDYGWGDAARLGRWNPVFITVGDSQPRTIQLQIHGTYGERGEALCVRQTAVADVIPTTYLLLFPLNTQPSRIEVIVSDQKTGKTLGSLPLQNPESFSPAGRVPMKLLDPQDILVGISGDIGEALALQTQLSRASVAAGILNQIKLPANFAGYDGISVLVLAAADLPALTPDQEEAILRWVRSGGNLLVIPGTLPLPEKSELMNALPCSIGVNETIALPAGSAATRPSTLNARELSPRPGADKFAVLNQFGFRRRLGLGRLAVLPIDVSPLQFADDRNANAFWKDLLVPMVKVPTPQTATEEPVSDEAENMLSSGPDAADSVGRGPRESVAIRHILELLGATGPAHSHDWQPLLLSLAGIFALIGPLDSIILMRLGMRPRNALTLIGWIGLLATMGTYALARQPGSDPTIASFRLLDQVNGEMVAATDIVVVKSDEPARVPLSLDETEWWEPANQAARSFDPDRFVDAICHEDRKGCRPESVDLTAGQPQAWHGESAAGDPGLLQATLSLHPDESGNPHLVGKLINDSSAEMSDIQIATASGNFRIDQSVAAGASIDVDATFTNKPIALSGLPEDATDVAPDRTDRIETLVKSGFACVYCQMAGAPGKWQVLRAAAEIAK